MCQLIDTPLFFADAGVMVWQVRISCMDVWRWRLVTDVSLVDFTVP